MQKYVVVYPRKCADFATSRQAGRGTVMLLTKAKPQWQRGRLNLVGGHVEEGESFERAATREFKEETKLTGWDFEKAGEVKGTGWEMEVWTCFVEQYANPKGLPAEPVSWYNWYDIRDDARLMENLRLIIPLCMNRERGWRLSSPPQSDQAEAVHIGAFVETGLHLRNGANNANVVHAVS